MSSGFHSILFSSISLHISSQLPCLYPHKYQWIQEVLWFSWVQKAKHWYHSLDIELLNMSPHRVIWVINYTINCPIDWNQWMEGLLRVYINQRVEKFLKEVKSFFFIWLVLYFCKYRKWSQNLLILLLNRYLLDVDNVSFILHLPFRNSLNCFWISARLIIDFCHIDFEISSKSQELHGMDFKGCNMKFSNIIFIKKLECFIFKSI